MQAPQNYRPGASSDAATPRLISAIADILRQTGLEADMALEQVRDAMSPNGSTATGNARDHDDDDAAAADAAAQELPDSSRTINAPRGLFQEQHTLWPTSESALTTGTHLPPLPCSQTPYMSTCHGTPFQSSLSGLQTISPEESSPSSDGRTVESAEGYGAFASSPYNTTVDSMGSAKDIQQGLLNRSSVSPAQIPPSATPSLSKSWSHQTFNSGFSQFTGHTQQARLSATVPHDFFQSRSADAPGFSPPEYTQRPQVESPRFSPGLSIPASHGSRGEIAQQGFRPMQAVLEPSARHMHARSQTLDSAGVLSSARFSDRYFGMHTEGNASAEHLPDHENCALWLRNLPPDVTYTELLASIRSIGRIWCTFINTPDFVSHSTAAAKVVFFAPQSARLFLAYVGTTQPSIRGFRIRADHNRIKYGQKPVIGNASRVLIVTGETWFVNRQSLAAFFENKFVFQVDEVIELVRVGGRAVVEFRFGSYRCQAQMGKMALDRIRPKGFEKAEFGDDPCEKGDSLLSYRIATERIQGGGI